MTYFIHTEVTLRLGNLAGYSAMMQELAPFMAGHGWHLVNALQPVTGDFRKLVHVWKLEDFGAVERGMGACASPEGQTILAPMASLVEAESIQVMAATSYV